MSDAPLPPWSPADAEYAAIVVTRPWQAVPLIQTQEANAATRAALGAEIVRLRRDLARVLDDYAKECDSEWNMPRVEFDAYIAALLTGEAP